jgi:CHAT domain-containing protein
MEMSGLEEQRRKVPPAGRLTSTMLAMGFPAYPPGSSLQPLPETKTEAEGVAALYHTKALIGAGATEAAAKRGMGQSSVVHLATHGVLDSVEPLHSFVALSAGDHEDGNLYASEIMDLSLRSDLVVFSACTTAGGDRLNGEGVLGLSWALAVAGAPNLLVTHWQIRSESSAQLMIEFESRLRPAGDHPRPSKAEALRQAQLHLMSDPKYRHPYFWAPFVLVGGD